MTVKARRRPAGARAAAALLQLLDEYEPEDFEAAKKTLGAREELVQVLTSLADIKRSEEAEAEADESGERAIEGVSPEVPRVSVEFLRHAVERELHLLQVPAETLARLRVHWHAKPLPIQKGEPVEKLAERLLADFDQHVDEPWRRVEILVTMLRETALDPERKTAVEAMLRRFAETALAENTLVFPSLASIGALRKSWAPVALKYPPGESRERLAERLLNDAVRHVPPEQLPQITLQLLKEGLRAPTDRLRASFKTWQRLAKSHVR